MEQASDVQESELLKQGLAQLKALLGPGWEIGTTNMSRPEPANLPPSIMADPGPDRVFQVRSQAAGRFAQLLVEAKETVTPSRLKAELLPQLQLMRQLTGDAAVLIIAPWVSPRTRAFLEELQFGYLDLTGNVSLRLPSLGIIIKTEGAAQAQQPTRGPWRQRLRGERAGALVRVLADVAPPYQASELAEAGGLSLGYVSRLLDALEEQNLIERDGRKIVRVDWVGILRERSASYQLLKAHPPIAMTAAKGIDATMDVLAGLSAGFRDSFVVTGGVAARAVAPLSIGGQLILHTQGVDDTTARDWAKRLQLLPATRGGDVLLLQTSAPEVFRNTRLIKGVAHVALSQLALDCMGGPGRLPADGEAVLEEMSRSEDAWRLNDLAGWGTVLR